MRINITPAEFIVRLYDFFYNPVIPSGLIKTRTSFAYHINLKNLIHHRMVIPMNLYACRDE
jgi:hypothetical protein